jgi:hypothetical protein
MFSGGSLALWWSNQIRPMFVVVSDSGHILSFGLTESQATEPFRLNLIWYDGPRVDVRPCSPALFRRLQVEEPRGYYSDCRINSEGIAVCRTGKARASPYRKR